MNVPDILGLTGALIAGVAYVPQISHQIRERCTAGISKPAFALWLISSILVTISAVAIQSPVFITLGCIQMLATAIIFIHASSHRGQTCEYHVAPVAINGSKKEL